MTNVKWDCHGRTLSVVEMYDVNGQFLSSNFHKNKHTDFLVEFI